MYLKKFLDYFKDRMNLTLIKRKKYVELQKHLKSLSEECEKLKEEIVTYKTWAPPGHFYSPIPSVEHVKENEDKIFSDSGKIKEININKDLQLLILNDIASFYEEMPFVEEEQNDLLYYFENPAFSYGDAILLYSMIRKFKPRKIVEIGSGYSSCVSLDTCRNFLDNPVNLTFIDPYPDLLKKLITKTDQKVEIIGEDIQKIDLALFEKLDKDDILFIDSTHVSKIGSDVNHIFFEILPSIKSGVIVHIHDIFYPFEYPKHWIYEGRAWNEDYMLRAFLQYNDQFEILFFNDYMAKFHSDELKKKAPLFLKNSGGSIWLRRK